MERGAQRSGVSSDAVRAATGRGWEEWFAALDAAGLAELPHGEIVARIARDHPEATTGWWRQSIAVAYERARGRREVGETAGAGFQVGVQRTLPAPAAAVWELLCARTGLWLGEGAPLSLVPGAAYELPRGPGGAGARGEVRVVRPGDRLRLTWRPAGWRPGAWDTPVTLQVALTERRPGATAVQVHLERLPDAAAREEARAHWRSVLEALAGAL